MKDNIFNVTYSTKHNVQLIGGKNSIKLMLSNNRNLCDTAWFSLFNDSNQELNSTHVKIGAEGTIYPLQNVTPGHYRLQVLLQKKSDSPSVAFWLRNIDVHIGRDRMVIFEKSPVFDHNWNLCNHLKEDHATIEKYKVLPRGDNREIIKKAYEITYGCISEYSKVLAIHDWIAQNIYYDMDSYTKKNIDYSKLGVASQVLSRRLAVCCGYSDLAVAMLRAIGIPAVSQSCYALGMSTSGHWTKQNVHHNSNHAITRVYIQKRWLLMDVTWDSPNSFKNGNFEKNGQVTHRYFDTTIQNISSTHKLCS